MAKTGTPLTRRRWFFYQGVTGGGMDRFIEEASYLREYLDDWIKLFGLPFKVFADAGGEGILQIHGEGIAREDATFADHITDIGGYIPKDVVKAMCLGAIHILGGLDAHAKGHSFAFSFLIKAAEEIGFCRGAGFGVVHEEESRREALSINGKKGAESLHGPRTELKEWALSQAINNRGAHKDIARKLANQLPTHLAGASKDPERLIYDTLRAAAKQN